MYYIRFNKIDNGYRVVKKAGKAKVVKNSGLVGLRNRKGIDEFTHLGYIYTVNIGLGRTVVETEEYVIIEFDITLQKAEALVAQEPELSPYILNLEEVEAILPAPIVVESGVT